MKAVVFEKTNKLSIQDLPTPKLDSGDVLIQMDLCGICASDIAALRGDVSDYDPPVVMGHELAGVVVESKHKEVRIGERVTVNPMMSCGVCIHCKNDQDKYCNSIEGIGHDINGGYAEYIRMPKHGIDTGKLIQVPKTMPPEELLFLEPLGCCISAMRETIFHETVAILGAGPIGLMFIQLAKRAGLATYVFEPLPHRRMIADAVGADATYDPIHENIEHLIEITQSGVDTVISATTNNTEVISLAYQVARKGGCINFFGLSAAATEMSINLEDFHYQGHKLMASWAFSRASLEESRQLLLQKAMNFRPLLTDRFTISEGLEAFDNAVAQRGIKTALHP